MKMPEISRQQKQYLARQKKEKHIILAARTLLFVLFMGLWEISSDLGWIDSFIFSSPSRIARCFWEMTLDQSIFLHIGITLYETLAVLPALRCSASWSLYFYGAVENFLRYWNLIWSF